MTPARANPDQALKTLYKRATDALSRVHFDSTHPRQYLNELKEAVRSILYSFPVEQERAFVSKHMGDGFLHFAGAGLLATEAGKILFRQLQAAGAVSREHLLAACRGQSERVNRESNAY
jgi:hypothetical protein